MKVFKCVDYELRKPLSPFICSTPLDFVEEREYLSQVVFPQLDRLCKSRGSSFTPVDLLWNPGQKKYKDGFMLKTHLDEIKKCAPFFICLLGETYGPFRSENQPLLVFSSDGHLKRAQEDNGWLDKNIINAASGGHPWILQKGHQYCSVTELEIIQGNSLCDDQHVTFYYRQSDHLDDKLQAIRDKAQKDEIVKLYSSESELCKEKIHALRQRLVNKGIPVKYFRTLEDLAQVVLEDWRQIIDFVLPPLIHDVKLLDTRVYNDWLVQESFLQKRAEVFVSATDIEETLEQITEFALTCKRKVAGDPVEEVLNSNTANDDESQFLISALKKNVPTSEVAKNIILLAGDRGCGKTTLVARWLQSFREDKCGICLISHFTSASNKSNNVEDFLRKSIEMLRKEFLFSEGFDTNSICAATERDSDSQSYLSLCETFKASLGLGPCVLLLDGVNELGPTHDLSSQKVKECSWLPGIVPETCKIILTTTKSDVSFRFLTQRPDVMVIATPGSLTNAGTTLQMVKEHFPELSQLIGGEKVLHQLSCLKIMQTPLGAMVIGSEICRPRVYTNLSAFLENYAEMLSLRNFWMICVQSWVQTHSWALGKPSSEHDKNSAPYGWVIDTLCLITLSRNGLTQNQILSILNMIGYVDSLEVSPYDWLQFQCSAKSTLYVREDGRIYFSHKYLQEISEYTFFHSISTCPNDPEMIVKLSQSATRRLYHGHLVRYFSQQPLDVQVMEELPWHMMMSGDLNGLVDYLTDYRILQQIFDEDVNLWVEDLKLYWSVCETNGQLAGMIYLELAKSFGIPTSPDQNGENSFSDGTITSPSPKVFVSEIQLEDESYESFSNNLSASQTQMTSNGNLVEKSVFVTQGSLNKNSTDKELIDEGNKEEMLSFSQVTNLFWNIASFLRNCGHKEEFVVLLTSLTKYLKQQNEKLGIREQILLCRCHCVAGELKLALEDIPSAEAEFRLALHAALSADNLDDDFMFQSQLHYLKALILCHQGFIHLQRNDCYEAEDLFKEALECIEDNPNCFVLKSTIFKHMASLRASRQEFPKAESYLREVLKLQVQWYGLFSRSAGDTLVMMAKVMLQAESAQGDTVIKVKSLLRQALTILEKCHGPSHASVADVLYDLGVLLADESSRAAKLEAQKYLQRSLDLRLSELGVDNHLTKITLQCLTRVKVALKMGQHGSHPTSRSTTRSNEMVGVRTGEKFTKSHNTLRADGRSDTASMRNLSTSRERPANVTDHPRLLRREKEKQIFPLSYESSENLKKYVNYGSNEKTNSSKSENLLLADHKHLLREHGNYDSISPDSYLAIENGKTEVKQIISLNLMPKEEINQSTVSENQSSHENCLDVIDKQINEKKKKHVIIQPMVHPRFYYQRIKTSDLESKSSSSISKISSSRTSNRLWSGRSILTDRSSASSAHSSHCHIPKCHDITVSNTKSVSGPHSDITSLLGDPPCPRPVSHKIHHRSAWYHVPGRYVTPQEQYPKKRMQKTDNAKEIETFVSMKTKWLQDRQKQIKMATFTEQEFNNGIIAN